MSKKKTKNAPPEKVKQKPVVKKTSFECETCKSQCRRGINYIESMKSGIKPKRGDGVVCERG